MNIASRFNAARTSLALAVLALGTSASAAHAQTNESRIRCADSSTQVVGRLGQLMFFTVTGYANDYVCTPFYTGRLGSAPNVYATVRHSGGQTSYRFCVNFRPAWTGQVVELWRGTQLIDRDRVVCW